MILFLSSLSPLLIALILLFFGIIFNLWLYLFLFLICPLTGGLVWFIYMEAHRKVGKTGGNYHPKS
jgi:hypothetical protein